MSVLLGYGGGGGRKCDIKHLRYGLILPDFESCEDCNTTNSLNTLISSIKVNHYQ